MLQIFADLSSMEDGILRIGGSDYNHIRNVLRMRPGEELSVYSLDGAEAPEDCDEYRFEILSFADDEGEAVCRLRFVKRRQAELPVRVVLYQGLPKSDKMDFIVQKAVEMGVSEVVPVRMHRSIVKLSGDKSAKRVARWQSIAKAAASQSRRAFIPQVSEVLSMAEAVRRAAGTADVVFVPYERLADEEETGTRALLDALEPGQTAAVFVGPEGGFEGSEVASIVEAGGHTVSLGRRILRTETAALAFLSFLIYRFEL